MFEAASPKEVDAIAASFIHRELTPMERRAKDLAMSRKLALKSVQYRLAGNEKMADVCSTRANMAFERAVTNPASRLPEQAK